MQLAEEVKRCKEQSLTIVSAGAGRHCWGLPACLPVGPCLLRRAFQHGPARSHRVKLHSAASQTGADKTHRAVPAAVQQKQCEQEEGGSLAARPSQRVACAGGEHGRLQASWPAACPAGWFRISHRC